MTRPMPLAGLRVAIVGKFSVYQTVVRDLIEEAGGTFVEFVDRSTSFLVCGMGSTEHGLPSHSHKAKIAAAKDAQVKIITESELEQMIAPYAEYDPEVFAQEQAEKLQQNTNYGDW